MNQKIVLLLVVIVLLASCNDDADLPPSPPPPGLITGTAGMAVGGVSLSLSSLPAWAAPILYTDISPTLVRSGDTLTVKISKEYLNISTDKTFYAFAAMYVFNKDLHVWEKFVAEPSQSGRITRDWAKDKAVFTIPIGTPRFSTGANFLLTYWCLDTGVLDAQGKKIWNCNGRRWGLGSFELQAPGFPNILIEQNIGTNQYRNSSASQTAEGLQYEALYDDTTGTTAVKIIQLNNVTAYKQSLAVNLPLVESLWTTLAGTCGFSQPESKKFTYLSGTNKIVVQTQGQALDAAKILAYNSRYPSDCALLDNLQSIANGASGICGNGAVEGNENCDARNDSACPNLCKPDCSCLLKGNPNTGVCGDLRVETPNSQGVLETCEPPEVRDPNTNLLRSGSPCFMRDPLTGLLGEKGHCSAQCTCVPGTVVLPRCGNGNCNLDESFSSCPADCLPENNPPNITVLTPISGNTFNMTALVYFLNATDDSSVTSCKASTDAGPQETMTGIGSIWRLTKLLSVGNHTVLFQCTDPRHNTRNVTSIFAVAAPQAPTSGTYRATFLDAQNNTINGVNATLYNGSAVVDALLSVNGVVEFSNVEYGNYLLEVSRQGYLPNSFAFTLSTLLQETTFHLTNLISITNASENATCIVPINSPLLINPSYTANDYCAGFIDSERFVTNSAVFVANNTSPPSAVPALRPHGMFDSAGQNLICTIPCATVVSSQCLSEVGVIFVRYQNTVHNYVCSGNH